MFDACGLACHVNGDMRAGMDHGLACIADEVEQDLAGLSGIGFHHAVSAYLHVEGDALLADEGVEKKANGFHGGGRRR